MTDYSKMSDFDINKAVAKALNLDWSIEPSHRVICAHSGKGNIYVRFNPCNSWVDAGPIIIDNKISLSNVIIRWDASALVYDDKFDDGFKIYRSNSGVESSSRGALRAAMIVFLMMKEQDDD